MDTCKFRCATEPFLFLYIAAYSIHYTVLPQLIISKVCSQQYNETVCSNLKLDRFKSEETHVYKDAATWNTIIFVCTIIPSLIFILPFGTLSDLVSKKKLLIVPPVLMILQACVYLSSAAVPSSHLAFLMLGAICSGIFGDLQGALALAYSYMADMIKMGPVRTLRMTILGGLIYYGTGFAACFSGLLLAIGGFSSTFILSLVLSFVNLAYVVFLLPQTDTNSTKEDIITAKENASKSDGDAATEKERLTDRKRSIEAGVSSEHPTRTRDNQTFATRTENSATRTEDAATRTENSATSTENHVVNGKSWITSAVEFSKIATSKFTKITTMDEHLSNKSTNRSMILSSLWKYTKISFVKIGSFAAKYRSSPRGKFILLLLAVYAFGSAAIQGESIIIVLFITHTPLSLNSQEVGTYLFALMALRGSGAFVFTFILSRLKPSDNLVIIIGLVSYISTYIAMGFSTTKQPLYGFSAFSFASTLTLSAVRSVLTKRVDLEENGTILCLCGFLSMVAESLFAVTTSVLFRSTVQILPGLSILCLAVLSLSSLVMMLVLSVWRRKIGRVVMKTWARKKLSCYDSSVFRSLAQRF